MQAAFGGDGRAQTTHGMDSGLRVMLCKAPDAFEHWADPVQHACCEVHLGSCRERDCERTGRITGGHFRHSGQRR